MDDIKASSYDKLTDQQKIFVDVIVETGDEQLAAKQAGYEKAIPITEDVRTAILDKATIALARDVPLAIANLRMVLKGDPKTILSATQRIKAAEALLDRAGVTKVERLRIEADQNSLVILPAKKPVGD